MKLDTVDREQHTDENDKALDPSETLARLVAESAWDKKALGLKVLDMRPLSTYTDFLVICSGGTERQVVAISEAVEESLKLRGHRPLGVEGRRSGRWVLVDYGDVVVHIFIEADRDVYGLESMWNDAPLLDIEAPPGLERPSYY